MSQKARGGTAVSVPPGELEHPGAVASSPVGWRILLAADLSLLLATAIWGTTFVVVKDALLVLPPFTFIALRFTVGSAALALLFGHHLRLPRSSDLHAGLVVGIFLFAGFAFQTLGLQWTSASSAGFITGLCVVLVPVVAYFWLGHQPSFGTAVGVGAAATGLAFLALRADLSLAPGDFLVLLCAVAFALQIVAVGRFAPRMDPVLLTVLQLGFVAAASWTVAFAIERPVFEPTPAIVGTLLFMGLGATALVFCIQNIAQRVASPTHAALIFTLEPVFAAFFAYLWLGERLTARGAIGAALIVAGMLAAELWRKR